MGQTGGVPWSFFELCTMEVKVMGGANPQNEALKTTAWRNELWMNEMLFISHWHWLRSGHWTHSGVLRVFLFRSSHFLPSLSFPLCFKLFLICLSYNMEGLDVSKWGLSDWVKVLGRQPCNWTILFDGRFLFLVWKAIPIGLFISECYESSRALLWGIEVGSSRFVVPKIIDQKTHCLRVEISLWLCF